MSYTIKYIGKQITIKNIKNAILDLNSTEIDTIILNPINFDEIAKEFKQTYNEEIPKFFFLLRVYIREDRLNETPVNRIQIIKNDQDPNRPLSYGIKD